MTLPILASERLSNDFDVDRAKLQEKVLGYRDLSPPVIREHFEAIGLDGDIVDHTALGSSLGKPIVKVVIAGAMWLIPICLFSTNLPTILTETTWEDLLTLFRNWSGGVIMISTRIGWCSLS